MATKEYMNLSSYSGGDSQEDPLLDDNLYYPAVLTLTGFRFIVCSIGIVCNVMGIVVFTRRGPMDSVTILFFALSTSDLAYVVIIGFYSASTIMSEIERRLGVWHPVDPFSIWIMTSTLSGMFNILGILITMLIAVLRCLCVTRPLQFKEMLSKKITVLLLAQCVLVVMICYVPLLVSVRPIPRPNRVHNATRILTAITVDDRMIDFVKIFVGSVLPTMSQVVVMVCLAVLCVCLRKASQFRSESATEVRVFASQASYSFGNMSHKHLQVVKQVTLISAIFAVCNVLNIGHGISSLVVVEYNVNKEFNNLYLFTINLQLVLSTVSRSVNFFIYLNFSSRFRLTFNSTFCFSVE